MSQTSEFQATEENNNRVLVVDDNYCLLEIVCQILLEKNYKVTGVESGETAIEELKIRSPLKEAELTKDEIRSLSKSMGLPTWDKPALACLASRIPYGTEITNEKLRRVDNAEFYLRSLGFYQVRVRDHEDIARIEVLPSEFNKLFSNGMMEEIVAKFKEIGYLYVTVDTSGISNQRGIHFAKNILQSV